MVAIKRKGSLQDFFAKLKRKATGHSVEVVQVGFLEGATYPDGTSVPMVAAVQEFGAPGKNIPPRPFFRKTIANGKEQWGQDLADLMKYHEGDTDKSLLNMGEIIKGELQETINEFDEVPLAPATIASKGFDKQLIDTAHMRNSVDYRVVKK